MSKELDALNNLDNENIVYVHKDYWNEIQNKLKALELVKEKTNLTKTNDGKKAMVFVILETQEEFELLKEVLL